MEISDLKATFKPRAEWPEWQVIESAPTEPVRTFDGNQFGPLILAHPVNGQVDTVEWWQSKRRPEACNFLDGGGNAAHPSHWMPLPDPPEVSKQ